MYGLIVTWDVLKHNSLCCFSTISARLIVTWDVLKPRHAASGQTQFDKINSNMRCIETFTVSRVDFAYDGLIVTWDVLKRLWLIVFRVPVLD